MNSYKADRPSTQLTNNDTKSTVFFNWIFFFSIYILTEYFPFQRINQSDQYDDYDCWLKALCIWQEWARSTNIIMAISFEIIHHKEQISLRINDRHDDSFGLNSQE